MLRELELGPRWSDAAAEAWWTEHLPDMDDAARVAPTGPALATSEARARVGA